MKSLTVQNPWAYAIFHCGKLIENRSRKTNYRGRILIHVSKQEQMNPMTSEYQREFMRHIMGKNPLAGNIIGSVEIIDCIKSEDDGSLQSTLWGNFYCWHWILKGPIRFDKPIPARGMLGLWEYKGEIPA
ncbi:hypothetical protein FACS1894137_14050 [Spirochaetia bacterium]|nr:hypothetical protein FACS1894137_14050 [Spirochaetia bacterium]